MKERNALSFTQLLSRECHAEPCRLSVAQFCLPYLFRSLPLFENPDKYLSSFRSACINNGGVRNACARVCVCTRAHIGRLYQVVQTIGEEGGAAGAPTLNSTPHAATVHITSCKLQLRYTLRLRLCPAYIYALMLNKNNND